MPQAVSAEVDIEPVCGVERDSGNAAAVIRAYGDLAHEFRNVLLAAQSSLELLRMRLTEPRLCALAERGLEALDRAGILVGRFQPLSCRHEPTPPRRDLAMLVSGLMPALNRLAGPGVAIRLALPPESLPVVVEAEQIALMLANLVLNARDAMPDGGRVDVTLRGGLQEGWRYAEISVADQGKGMSEATAARAIEPYFSGPGHAGKGAGLGLSQVYALAQRCGGRLTIDSEIGCGTIVRFQLPIAAPPP